MGLTEKQKILDSLKTFKNINEKTYHLLGTLNYQKEDTVILKKGKWEVYTKRDFIFPYFLKTIDMPVNKFAAIYKEDNEFIIYGSFEKLEEVKENLEKLIVSFLFPVGKIFGIHKTLIPENAQDYGYTRGLLLGGLFMGTDILYSLIFKLKNGVFTGFIEYIKLVYDGIPNLGIGIGIVGSGFYFGILLIFLPIFYGNICVVRAKKIEEMKLKELPDDFLSYEYGVEAERALEEEFNMILEERKKKEIYEEIKKIWQGIDDSDFEMLYQRLKEGFFSPESLYGFLTDIKKIESQMDLMKFLEIIIKFQKALPRVELKLNTGI